jgi:hypothetical protein
MSAVFVLITIICLFTPSLLFFKQLTAYTLYFMLGMLAAGFLYFFFRQEKLMVISLLCCGILCLHLKASANKKMRLATETTDPSLKISHISLGNAENDYDSVVNYLLSLDVDFVSVQELTPDWNAELSRRLADRYKYIHTMTRLDQYGMGFFSRIPFTSIDTTWFQHVPNYTASVQVGGKICNIIGCQVIPPVNQAAFRVIENHFRDLNTYMHKLPGSFIVLGDLHLPSWASEIQKFKEISRLQDSRRDINPRNVDGSVTLPRIPVEHIFFSDEFECTAFSELGNSTIGRIGITGTYQLNSSHAEMTE